LAELEHSHHRPVSVATGASARAMTLEECEREHILRALGGTRWVVGGPNGAAAVLDLKRTTLIWKMQKLGIARSGKRSKHCFTR
jgi:transcriptional regulator with GAF, ATPase, and Fis domain